MRLSGTKTGAVNQYRGLGNQLWDLAGNRPSLDLPFSDTKSLVDTTTGKTLVDHTRASSGTYVGSDGLIKTATTNLLLRSEEFQTTWFAVAGSIASDAGQAPNGTTTADQITPANGAASAQFVQGTTITSGATVTGSLYIKSSGFDRIQIMLLAGNNTNPYGFATFNASTGAIDTAAATSNGGSNVSAVITPIGNGWYRASVTVTYPAVTSAGMRLFVTNSDASNGDGTKGVLVWGAQLEQSSTVGEYIPTTSTINSAPRFDHDPTTGESLGLLVEESRTNLIADSSLTTIGALSGATKSSTTETNPEGIDFCQRLLCVNSFAYHRINIPATSSNNIAVSAFVKRDTHRYVYIGFGGTVNSFSALFDIDPTVTGDRLLGQGGNGTYTNIDAGYQNFPNGWVRIWAVGTTSGGDGTTIGFSPDDSTYNLTAWSAAGTEAIFIHGVQYEDNVTFPTSYIPTTTTTVTRAADVASISGTNFSSFYNQSASTVYAEFSSNTPDGASALYAWTLYASGADHLAVRTAIGYNPDRLIAMARVGGSNEFSSESNAAGYLTMPVNTVKGAFAFASNDFAINWNGGAGFTSGFGAIPTVSNLYLGSLDGSGSILNGHIKRLACWSQRLPNETLSAITQ